MIDEMVVVVLVVYYLGLDIVVINVLGSIVLLGDFVLFDVVLVEIIGEMWMLFVDYVFYSV